MKKVKLLLLLPALIVAVARGEEWRKVAFIGNADVKSVTGLVEVVSGNGDTILHEKDVAVVGQTLRIWRGAEVIIQMKNSHSLVRAKGPTLLRLAPESEAYDRAALTGEEDAKGFVVRAVHGGGKYQVGTYWRDLHPGMSIPEGAKVRPFRDSILDFYHPATRTAYRVTDHSRQTALAVKMPGREESSPTIMAAKAP
jgi:hypothetical protein